MRYLFLLVALVGCNPESKPVPSLEDQRQAALEKFCVAHPSSLDCTGPCTGNDGSDPARFIWP